MYDDFSAAADGAPTVADTGQTYTLHRSTGKSDNSYPIVTDGILTNGLVAADGSNKGNGYLNVSLENDVTRIGGRFVLGDETAASQVALLILESPIVGAIPDMSVHLLVGPTKWTLGYWDNNPNVVDIMNGYFGTPLADDGTTVHEIDVTVDYTASRVTVVTSSPSTSPADELDNADSVHTPDGKVHSITDANIALYKGRHACFEVLALAGADTPFGWIEGWADDET